MSNEKLFGAENVKSKECLIPREEIAALKKAHVEFQKAFSLHTDSIMNILRGHNEDMQMDVYKRLQYMLVSDHIKKIHGSFDFIEHMLDIEYAKEVIDGVCADQKMTPKQFEEHVALSAIMNTIDRMGGGK